MGVTFVVPVHNGGPGLRATLEAIRSQCDGRPVEILVVDDRSSDASVECARRLPADWPLCVLDGEGRGAAAAINRGIRAARHPILCQVDQDVVIQPGWLERLLAALADPSVAAVQGYYENDAGAGLCARAMNLDLEQRYAAIDGDDVDHVCSGNTAYRLEPLKAIGGFDERLGYGYDNDVSYRLQAAGYRLLLCRQARSVHRWREGLAGYVAQQYGFGYGRLDVVAKHPGRVFGDQVSPTAMMVHPLALSGALSAFVLAVAAPLLGLAWRPAAAAGALIIGALVVERLIAGISAARRFGTRTPLVFPFLHLVRDGAWLVAMGVWLGRRLKGQPRTSAHSMAPNARQGDARTALRPSFSSEATGTDEPRPWKVLCLIPAHNEAANLAAVVGEVRRYRPDLDLLVIDDGSTDGTATVLREIGVRCLRFPERLGVGSAMRAGIRYAARSHYDAVVRIDGDGQHRAAEIGGLLLPLGADKADVVIGTRYSSTEDHDRAVVRSGRRMLAACLTLLTRQHVTDPTSGFLAIGRRALPLLSEHHPTGYAEPELRLLLSRNALRVVETPVQRRSRMSGTTSLTRGRLAGACARVMLALIIVPLRRREELNPRG